MYELAEHIAELLDIGPATRVFEVDCGDGALLFPFHQNNYLVGGSDTDARAIARALEAMPDGQFHVGPASSLDPAAPWQVVICRSFGSLADVDDRRGLLARMFAKATHAIALLNVPERHREWMMHALAEIGASAIQFENADHRGPALRESPPEPAGNGREPNAFNVFARV